MGSTREVYMATVKQEQQESGLTQIPSEPACEAQLDPADYELDEQLRTLRFDQWFAMVEEGMPIWAC
jgi:hypothetical protein